MMKYLLIYGSFLLFPFALFSQSEFSESCLSNHPANDRYGSYSPDGKSIIFESDRHGNWDIFLLDLTSGEQRAITFSPQDERRPSWHPGGRSIIFEIENQEGVDLYEHDLYIGLSKKILRGPDLGGSPLFARYAPSGKFLAYSLQKSEEEISLHIFDLVTKKHLSLSDNNSRNVFPMWSPDGNHLLLFSRKDTQNQDDEIYRINLKNGKWKRLTRWPQHNFCPAWSPDGEWIAYVTSMKDSRPEIYIMNKKGKKKKRITYNELGETLPMWSPDGRKLLITAFRNGNYELCEIEVM
jgi:Tol biopolymer transport system component